MIEEAVLEKLVSMFMEHAAVGSFALIGKFLKTQDVKIEKHKNTRRRYASYK
jgi:hypothetical protein